MKNFKHFLFWAAAAALSLGFVGCSDDSDDFKEDDAIYSHSTLEYVCDYSGNYFELIDMTVEASIQNGTANSDYTINNANGKLTITFNKLTANSSATITITHKRNTTAIDANKTYGRQEHHKAVATRHFTNGTTGKGGNDEFNKSISSIDKSRIEEYVTSYGSESFTFRLNAEGKLSE